MPTPKKVPIRRGRLDTGDELEYGMSQEMPYPKGATTWVRYAVKVTKRAGESDREVLARAQNMVETALDAKINEIVGTK